MVYTAQEYTKLMNNTMQDVTNIDQTYLLAQQVIPGGVNSPVRAGHQVGGQPLYVSSANGAYLKDTSGKKYLDYINGYGPVILGHADPGLKSVIESTASLGWIHGQCHTAEIEFASLIGELIAGIEQVRLMNSGTEAAMTAVRLARGLTKRTHVIQFGGHYHGHADTLMPQPSDGGDVINGIPSTISSLTQRLCFNDLNAVKKQFEANPEGIAAVLVEPIAGNMGMIFSDHDFLKGLRQLCDQYGSLLIFDEVMTGFRVGLTGATGLLGVQPDLWVYGKIIGGGFPVGALAGPRAMMSELAPSGRVYQGGTFAANPMVVNAGLHTLRQLMKPGVYEQLNHLTSGLVEGIDGLAKRYQYPIHGVSAGGMCGVFMQNDRVIQPQHYTSDAKSLYPPLYHALLEQSILWPPSPDEAMFINLCHNEETLGQTLSAVEKVLQRCR